MKVEVIILIIAVCCLVIIMEGAERRINSIEFYIGNLSLNPEFFTASSKHKGNLTSNPFNLYISSDVWELGNCSNETFYDLPEGAWICFYPKSQNATSVKEKK